MAGKALTKLRRWLRIGSKLLIDSEDCEVRCCSPCYHPAVLCDCDEGPGHEGGIYFPCNAYKSPIDPEGELAFRHDGHCYEVDDETSVDELPEGALLLFPQHVEWLADCEACCPPPPPCLSQEECVALCPSSVVLTLPGFSLVVKHKTLPTTCAIVVAATETYSVPKSDCHDYGPYTPCMTFGSVYIRAASGHSDPVGSGAGCSGAWAAFSSCWVYCMNGRWVTVVTWGVTCGPNCSWQTCQVTALYEGSEVDGCNVTGTYALKQICGATGGCASWTIPSSVTLA